jgi:hypothetical protein
MRSASETGGTDEDVAHGPRVASGHLERVAGDDQRHPAVVVPHLLDVREVPAAP